MKKKTAVGKFKVLQGSPIGVLVATKNLTSRIMIKRVILKSSRWRRMKMTSMPSSLTTYHYSTDLTVGDHFCDQIERKNTLQQKADSWDTQ